MRRPFHPLLFAAFPILFLIAHNRDRTSGAEGLVPLALAVASAGAVLIAASRWNARKGAVIVSAAAIAFFTYGHVWNLLEGRAAFGIVYGRDLVLGPLFAAAGLATVVAVTRTSRSLVDLTRILNIIAIALAGSALVQIGLDAIATPPAAASVLGDIDGRTPSDPRDIYYLIFDRYPDADVFDEHFGFENDLVGDLEERGFVVADEARANYQNTHLSLASSLNLDVLDPIKERVGVSDDLEPVFQALSDHTAGRFLKEHGYRYVHVGSWASFTSSSAIADVNIHTVPVPEFSRAFYTSTALAPLFRRGIVGGGHVTDDQAQLSSTTRAFEAIDETLEMDGPTFVFAHFIVPHPPYIYDRHGNVEFGKPREGNVEAYLEQVRYTNDQIRRVVDRLLAGPDDEDPIIVIQGDEGPYPNLSTHVPGTWVNASDDEVRVKFGILNAYHLPGEQDAISPAMSPVNTFRVIFNRYFGTDLDLLADESYASRAREDVYTFVPLGEKVRGRPPPFVRQDG